MEKRDRKGKKRVLKNKSKKTSTYFTFPLSQRNCDRLEIRRQHDRRQHPLLAADQQPHHRAGRLHGVLRVRDQLRPKGEDGERYRAGSYGCHIR